MFSSLDNIHKNRIQYLFLKKLKNAVPKFVQATKIKDYEIYVKTTSRNLFDFVDILKNKITCQFDQLIDIAVIDKPQEKFRFQVTYLFLSIRFNARLYLVTKCSETGALKSLTSLFKSSGWLEREVWDMYGIFFFQHSDLRRILTDYGFLGHPLRKDFPLFGFKEVFFNEEMRKVTFQTVQADLKFRSFSYGPKWIPANNG